MDNDNMSIKPTKRKRETKPKEPKPKETKPKETKPKETKPKETKPKETKSEESKPKKKKLSTIKATTEPDRKILVAVDFGTTFSGLAWAQTRKPEIQTPISQWPDSNSEGLEGVSSDKVPTEIKYNGRNFKWGFQIEDSVPRHQWFKLDLDPSQLLTTNLASQYHDPLKAPPHYDEQPVNLTTDYMTGLREHTERILRYKLPQSALVSTPIEYIITVPAVWSDMAQAKTRACAEAAGMGAGAALHIVSEPEAAALYALDALDPHNLRTGDTFVLCDAGGGTVDLITYTVSTLRPILKLTEASPGSGSLCGASFLNRKFEEFLEDKLKGAVGWDDWREEVLDEAMKRFESVVKRQFRGTFGEEFIIPVSGLQDDKALGIRRNKLTLAGTQIRAIFDPVLEEVLKLVMGQINASQKPVKAVILVGGFGQNAYLRDTIREEVMPFNIEVMQPANSWTAVVRGALMKGLASTSPAFAKVKISGRSARKHYGVCAAVEYSKDKHARSHRIWEGFYGVYRVYMMDWFIIKGKTVKEDSPIRLPYNIRRLTSEGPFTAIKVTIFYSSDPYNTGAPKYQADAGVTKLVEVEADLSRIPTHLIPRAKGADGKMYYKVDYKIQVTYYSAYTTYELIYNNVNYGLVSSEYV